MDYDRLLVNGLPNHHLSFMNMGLFAHMLTTLYSHISKGSVFLALLVYVDDIILAANDSDTCKQFKEYLYTCFSIKDLGPMKTF